MPKLNLNIAGTGERSVQIDHLVIAGWAGRDAEGVQHHIRELEAIGVKAPSTVPCYYPLAAALLTTDDEIEVPRADSSGEVEAVLLSTSEGLLVGIGSDHTDRKAEAYDVTVSKQMCAKPVSRDVWRFDEVAGHWDDLIARCWRTRNGVRELYQEGAMTSLRDPRELAQKYANAAELPVGTAMYCGTQPVKGELGYGEKFEFELHDPKLNRSLTCAYTVRALPVAD
ncbi:hypothetical protein CAL29_14390 [Bordetella genomosp. 10]|uniref:DUF2848 domain-containing protein n=1 Tax=Bordetella genomosp. 10 TaxID=1416804 RepID=A0A261SBD8_9BORD|nr:DUF2848 domain-containing protein [Bordetella genomosp. 10]OZI34676.1 hypothetical protein CAL29_14390 [Bordetella genomosp. 10]